MSLNENYVQNKGPRSCLPALWYIPPKLGAYYSNPGQIYKKMLHNHGGFGKVKRFATLISKFF